MNRKLKHISVNNILLAEANSIMLLYKLDSVQATFNKLYNIGFARALFIYYKTTPILYSLYLENIIQGLSATKRRTSN